MSNLRYEIILNNQRQLSYSDEQRLAAIRVRPIGKFMVDFRNSELEISTAGGTTIPAETALEAFQKVYEILIRRGFRIPLVVVISILAGDQVFFEQENSSAVEKPQFVTFSPQ